MALRKKELPEGRVFSVAEAVLVILYWQHNTGDCTSPITYNGIRLPIHLAQNFSPPRAPHRMINPDNRVGQTNKPVNSGRRHFPSSW